MGKFCGGRPRYAWVEDKSTLRLTGLRCVLVGQGDNYKILVLSELSNHPIPVAIVMAGGYAPNVEDIVDIHLETIRTAVEYG